MSEGPSSEDGMMRFHLERLSAVGRRAVSVYVIALLILAASSVAVVIIVSLAPGNAAESPSLIVLQILFALFSSLAAAALTAVAVVYAMQRLLAVYVALVLYGLNSKTLEVAEPAPPIRERAAAPAPQPVPRAVKPAVEQPVAVTQRAAVSEKKKCPYCGRVLPFGDVHVVCPYCGRRLK